MEVTLKFYDDKKFIILPEDYNIFISELALMLNVPNNKLNVNIFYTDNEGDKILITNSGDYEYFIEDVKRKKITILEIELKEENSENSLEQLRESFIKFPSKEIIINNKNEEIKKNNIKPVISNIDKNDKNNNENINKENKEIIQLVQPIEIINPNKNDNKISLFNLKCYICGKNPINLLIYKCYECNFYYCNECEIKEGKNHPHPLLKVRTNEQLKKWDNLLSKIDFKKNEIPQKNNKNMEIKYKNKINEARNKYDLKNISDQQLEEVLKNKNGNIDEAVIELFK